MTTDALDTVFHRLMYETPDTDIAAVRDNLLDLVRYLVKQRSTVENVTESEIDAMYVAEVRSARSKGFETGYERGFKDGVEAIAARMVANLGEMMENEIETMVTPAEEEGATDE